MRGRNKKWGTGRRGMRMTKKIKKEGKEEEC